MLQADLPASGDGAAAAVVGAAPEPAWFVVYSIFCGNLCGFRDIYTEHSRHIAALWSRLGKPKDFLNKYIFIYLRYWKLPPLSGTHLNRSGELGFPKGDEEEQQDSGAVVKDSHTVSQKKFRK